MIVGISLGDIERRNELQRGTRTLLRVTKMFIIFTTCIHTCSHMSKLIKLYILNMCDLLNVSYILTYLLKMCMFSD